MYKAVPTLTDFALEEGRPLPQSSGNFITLITQIENAVKVIASHVRASGLVDILGKTGVKNSFGEEVQKLDEFANKLLIDTLLASGEVHALISEEEEKIILAPKTHAGEFIVYFDPLDGSSNIDTNCPIGTIFSIYRKKKDVLQKGSEQVAAGYAIYGSSVMFVYSVGNGVNGFTLDPNIGSFLLSHPQIQMPKKGSIYSINEAYETFYADNLKKYLFDLKKTGSYKARYVGSLIADAHRTFLKGGIFLYPADTKQPKGKLRLMLEVNPFAFLVEQAGGSAVSTGNVSPLTLLPEHIHQRAPLILGSVEEVEKYLTYCSILDN